MPTIDIQIINEVVEVDITPSSSEVTEIEVAAQGPKGDTVYVGVIGGNAPDRVFSIGAQIAGGVTP